MSAGDRILMSTIAVELEKCSRDVISLPGIDNPNNLASLTFQIKDSIHRVRYAQILRSTRSNHSWADPSNEKMFNPLRAAATYANLGDIDEAAWFLFLFVHFGKHLRGGWRYCREVYGCLGNGACWTWRNICRDPNDFLAWLEANRSFIQRREPAGGFGNHRKYLSLGAYNPVGTGMAVLSYIKWITESGDHATLFTRIAVQAGHNSKKAFEMMYSEMSQVVTFGRLAKFDYLAMLGKLGLAPIEPGRPFLHGATGPTQGANLLFTGRKESSIRVADLERMVCILDAELSIGSFSMQVLEDALCNWQKSPDVYSRFWG